MIDLILPIRALQWLFGLIVLGLTAYMAHWYDGHTGINFSPDSVSFLLFCAVWTMVIAVPYLALSPTYFPRFAHKFAILGLDALTMLFWFAGFIALAVFHSNLILCYGNVCNCMVAAIVFGAFEWILFTATTALGAYHVMRTRNSNSTKPATEMEVHPGV